MSGPVERTANAPYGSSIMGDGYGETWYRFDTIEEADHAVGPMPDERPVVEWMRPVVLTSDDFDEDGYCDDVPDCVADSIGPGDAIWQTCAEVHPEAVKWVRFERVREALPDE